MLKRLTQVCKDQLSLNVNWDGSEGLGLFRKWWSQNLNSLNVNRFSLRPMVISLILFCNCSSFLIKEGRPEKEGASEILNSLPPLDTIGPELLTADFVKARVRQKLKAFKAEFNISHKQAVYFISTDLYMKANDLSIQNKSILSALLFERLVELNPYDHYLKKRLGVELIRTGQVQKARPLFEKLFSLKEYKKEVFIGLILGGIYVTKGDLIQAEKTYIALLKNNPRNAEGCIILAKLYDDQGKEKKVYQQLSECERK